MKNMKRTFSAMLIGAICLGATSFVANANILNSSNVSQKDGWKFWAHAEIRKAGVKSIWSKDGITVEIPECKHKGNYTVQVYTNTNDLLAGKKYKISFDLKSNKVAKIEISYILGKAPYTSYAKQIIKVEAAKKQYECILAPKQSKDKYDTPRSLRFFIGNIQNNKVSISNVKIEEIN